MLSAATILSCSKDDNANYDPEPKLKEYGTVLSLDITDAKALYVTKTDLAGNSRNRTRSDDSDVTIHKITVDDKTSEVFVRDENGEIIPLVSCDLYLLTDDLIGFCFGYETYYYLTYDDDELGEVIQSYAETKYETYWIRKSDGAAFKVPKNFWRLRQGDFKMDNSQSLYYLFYGQEMLEDGTIIGPGFYKIYTDSDNGISARPIGNNFISYIANGYIVDGSGNVYFGREYDRLHCIFANGADYLSDGYFPSLNDFYNYSTSQDCNLMLCTSDDSYYSLTYEVDYEVREDEYVALIQLDIHRTKVNNGRVESSLAESFNLESNGDIEYIHVRSREYGIVLISIGYFDDTNDLIVFNPSENRIDRYHDVDLGYNEVHNSANYAYWVNQAQGVISRFSYLTGTIESVYSNSNYDISDFSVSSNDDITFSATNLTTLDKMMCEIIGGVFSESKIEPQLGNSNDEIIAFIRVN